MLCPSLNAKKGRSTPGVSKRILFLKSLIRSMLHLQHTGHGVKPSCCGFLQLQGALGAAQHQAVVLGMVAACSQLAPHLQLHHGVSPAASRRHAHQLSGQGSESGEGNGRRRGRGCWKRLRETKEKRQLTERIKVRAVKIRMGKVMQAGDGEH